MFAVAPMPKAKELMANNSREQAAPLGPLPAFLRHVWTAWDADIAPAHSRLRVQARHSQTPWQNGWTPRRPGLVGHAFLQSQDWLKTAPSEPVANQIRLTAVCSVGIKTSPVKAGPPYFQAALRPTDNPVGPRGHKAASDHHQ